MIVATAGHIDHGKTSLIKALTGIETDRLPEERARGMTIDLGFAHAELGQNSCVSFIDVPGHERFVRNMLAGVTGINAALLIVAADDGLMPQTLEHLHILDLLNVERAAIVITKVDKVDAARVECVSADITAMIHSTSIAGAPVFGVNCITGDGISTVRDWLLDLSGRSSPVDDISQGFRMPIDRAFTIAGSGTVVTGTVHSGKVSVDDQLMISPEGIQVRVRGIQVHGVATEFAYSGQRCALNLVGVNVSEAGRGNWIQDSNTHAPTNRLDVRLKVIESEDRSLLHWSCVHLHLGTTDVLARVVVSGEGKIEPGQTRFVQLITDKPIAALHGDRFIIRDQSASRTIGGGIVMNPFALKQRRGAGVREAEMQVYERSTPEKILSGLLDLSEAGVDIHSFCRAMNLLQQNVGSMIRDADAIVLGKAMPIGISRAASDALKVSVLEKVRKHHTLYPQDPGIGVSALRSMITKRIPFEAFQALIRDLANRKLLVLSNDVVSLRDHDVSANPEDEKLWKLVHETLLSFGVNTPLVGVLAEKLKVKEQPLRDFLHRKSRTGDIRRVTPDRFCLRETLTRLAAVLVDVANKQPGGFFNAAQFRDAIGTGRGLAIHYLEFFDQLGVTQRFGDRRRIGKRIKEFL